MQLKSIPKRLGYILGAQWTRDLSWTIFTILLARTSQGMLGQIMLALSYGYLVKTAADVDSSIDPIARIMTGMPSMVNNASSTYQTITGENLRQLNKLLAGDLNSVTGDIVDIMARPVIEGLLRALFFGLAFVACEADGAQG